MWTGVGQPFYLWCSFPGRKKGWVFFLDSSNTEDGQLKDTIRRKPKKLIWIRV